jgi:hypothetical protein
MAMKLRHPTSFVYILQRTVNICLYKS